MNDTVIIRDNGGDQGWAHVRLLGSALRGIGLDVARVMAGPDKLPGSLVAKADGLSAERLRQHLDLLRRDNSLGAYLNAIVVEAIDRKQADELVTEPLQDVAVALFGSAGAPYHQLDIFASSGFDVAPIGSEAIRAGGLAGADVFVMPGGGWEFMEGQLSRLGVDGARAIHGFVEAGGCYLSSCAGTHSVLRQPSAALKDWHPAYADMPKLSAISWLRGTRHTHHIRSPGIGVIQVRLHDRMHPVALGLPNEFDCVYYNGPIILPDGEGYTSVLDCISPDRVHFTPGEALLGRDSVNLDETALAEAGAKRYSAGGLQSCGNGWIVGFGLHPEFGCEPSMLQWGVAARLLVNAAEWTSGQARASKTLRARRLVDPTGWRADTSAIPDAESVCETAITLLGEIEVGFQRLTKLPETEVEPWLGRDIARSAFGRGPSLLWRSSLHKGAELAREMMVGLNVWKASCRDVEARASQAPRPLAGRLEALRANAIRVASLPAVDVDRQDLGFKGIPALLADVRDLLDTLTVEGEFAPYKAVAMSYLSAFGRLTSASLTLSASNAMLARARLMAEIAFNHPADHMLALQPA